MGIKIEESLRVVEDVDVAGDGIGWGRCLHIRVTIDLFKPLKHGRALDIEKKSVWINFKYENLQLSVFGVVAWCIRSCFALCSNSNN